MSLQMPGPGNPIVLEAVEIGFGGAGRNVGLVNAGLWVRPEAVPAAIGVERGERLLKQLGEAPALVFDLISRHGIDCEAVRAGTLHCAADRHGARDLAERARQWRRRGVAVELIEGTEAARLTGSEAFASVLLDPRAGTIQPLAYVRGLARAAIRHGARIHVRTPALRCEDLGDVWRIKASRRLGMTDDALLDETGLDSLALPRTFVRPASIRSLKGAIYEVGAQLAHAMGARF